MTAPSEEIRLQALRGYEILDTPPEPNFDRLVQLAAAFCNTPIAFISLIDEHRQWFKAKTGLAVDQTERCTAFCDFTIRDVKPLLVHDALQDPRFQENPHVQGDMGIRFYAGIPLITATGFALGALAVVDNVPRALDETQIDALRKLADQVVVQLEQRRLHLLSARKAAIMEMIATDAPLPQVMDEATRIIEAYDPRFLCAVHLLDGSGKRFQYIAAPTLPPAYVQAIIGLEIGPNVGSCGTAAFDKRIVVVSNIATDPLWKDYADIALRHGLQACWSVPIFSASKEVLGTFAVYASSPRTPEPTELELLQSFSHIVSLAIERSSFIKTLRQQAALLDKTQDAVMTRTIDGRVMFWNKSAERLFGWKKEEVLGRGVDETVCVDEAAFRKTREETLEKGHWKGEMKARHKDGRILLVEAGFTLVRDNDGKPELILCTGTDITERKRAEQEIHHLAFYDQLTGLPNRRLLIERVQHALAKNERSHNKSALLLIDLDNFKTINDTLGHDKGDMLLQQVAQRLMTCVRKSDTVARLGGDEFVVVLEALDGEEPLAASKAEQVTKNILAHISQPYGIAGYECLTTPSIGVTLFQGRPRSVDELLKEADLAMYGAKAQGRNAIRFFDPEMQSALALRSKMEAELRLALSRDEFELHYQPQFNDTGYPIGVEALLRWRHPARGLVSPTEFIPLAEDTGLIVPLGQWVLQTACAQLASWSSCERREHLSMAVNVSGYQFRRADFVESVLQVLSMSKVDPFKIKLEITESVLVEDMEDAITKMSALKARGVRFSLDDFGTGYSSLSYLQRLPIDQLKIDRSFVQEAANDANGVFIARTIIGLGCGLGLEVIAEGVETEIQRSVLAQHGCHAYQGYLFSKPLPAHEIEQFLLDCTNLEYEERALKIASPIAG